MSDDIDLDRIANALYPNAEKSPPREILTRPTYTADEVQQAERIYGPPRVDPDLPQPGEGLYSASGALRATTERNFLKLYDAGVVSAAQKEDAHREVTEMTRELGLDWGYVRLVEDASTEAQLADRIDDPVADAAMAVQIRADVEGTRKRLREKYGAAEADDLLDRVSRFKQQDARLAARLDRRGIGWREAIVDATIDEVRRVNFR